MTQPTPEAHAAAPDVLTPDMVSECRGMWADPPFGGVWWNGIEYKPDADRKWRKQPLPERPR